MINTMAPDMEPAPVTDLELTVVLDELLSREPIFHRPEHGSSRADFDRMMTTDFWEIGASGQRYSRNDVLDELDRRRKNPGPDAWQRVISNAGNSRRISICSRTLSCRTTSALHAVPQSGSAPRKGGRLRFTKAQSFSNLVLRNIDPASTV
jgi:hypothetical protein